jgi:hypothetical protein
MAASDHLGGQFEETIRQRHSAGQPFSADEIEGMDSENFRLVQADIAYEQRGKPESAMDDAQREVGGGVWPHLLEHVGDLTHRMQEPYATNAGRYNAEYVAPKLRAADSYLNSPYGFEREMDEQIESNARYNTRKGKPVASTEDVARVGQVYADAHRALPAYNRPVALARDAAVSLGEQRFDDTRRQISDLKSVVESPDTYQEEMSRTGAVNWLRQREN